MRTGREVEVTETGFDVHWPGDLQVEERRLYRPSELLGTTSFTPQIKSVMVLSNWAFSKRIGNFSATSESGRKGK
jgi:hypothetical protein